MSMLHCEEGIVGAIPALIALPNYRLSRNILSLVAELFFYFLDFIGNLAPA